MSTESRSPHQAVTKDLIERIDTALTATHGHRAHAALLLGVDENRLKNVIHRTPNLKAKWTARNKDAVEPTLSAEIDRPEGIQPFSPDELKAVAALDKQESVLAKGWDKLDFADEKKNFFIAVQNEHGAHWGKLGTMFQGGLVYTANEALYQSKRIIDLIADVDENPDKYERTVTTQFGVNVTKTAHETRLELMDRLLKIADLYRKLNADYERANLIRAQVEKIKVEEAKDVKKRARPAWEKPEVTVREQEES